MVTSDLQHSIQTELLRLQLHPVNLDVVSEENGQAVLRGSLLNFWKVPKTVDSVWFLELLTSLADKLGPEATMNAFAAAIAAVSAK
ncbi:MAG: hypothetical protein SFV81_26910 [Pirellulaceae bacterium]|nr:hypothetical protein [Pirellulaceae bacterium]